MIMNKNKNTGGEIISGIFLAAVLFGLTLFCAGCFYIPSDTEQKKNDSVSLNVKESDDSAVETDYSEETTTEKEDLVLFEDDYVKCVFRGVTDGASYGLNVMYLSIKTENKLDQSIIVMIEDVAVNGEMISMPMKGLPSPITPGHSGTDSIVLPLGNTDVIFDDVESIEFKIVISNDNYDTIDTSDVITLYF